ncbi:hypothetical protein DPMN_016940 [Dreissena polymorpha]|uniref:Uncharacterized protein n=1 Tax=Dreissena polymorpha TaxID=45954 RepID=A0A9D4NE99_DREPO|nr:hypothetical protein DPMN_016940 [Dreissena polymorpha]
MVFLNIDADTDLNQVTIVSAIKVGVINFAVHIQLVISAVWNEILTFSVQGQVLTALVCLLIINILLINIFWRVYRPIICNPEIAGLVAKYSDLRKRKEGQDQAHQQ